MTMRDEGLTLAIEAAGSISELARRLGISRPAVSQWRTVPVGRVSHVAWAVGVEPRKLRPDLEWVQPKEGA